MNLVLSLMLEKKADFGSPFFIVPNPVPSQRADFSRRSSFLLVDIPSFPA